MLQQNESAWNCSWRDTKHGWTGWRFLLLEAVVSPIVGFAVGTLTDNVALGFIAGIGVVIVGLVSIWIGATMRTPYKQRDEARTRVHDLEAELQERKLFDVVCPTTSLGLPINHLDDGTYRASVVGLGFSPIIIAHRGKLTNVTRITAIPQVRFIRPDNLGWETSDAIRVAPLPLLSHLAPPGAMDFAWDVTNPAQWVLTGLPLAMGQDEQLQLPQMIVTVSNANEAGAHFAKHEKCTLIIRLAMRSDRGSPTLSDQSIELTVADIKDALQAFGFGREVQGQNPTT